MTSWRTTLNTTIEPTIGSVGYRLLAAVIDLIILSAALTIILSILGWFDLSSTVVIICCIPLMLYTLLFEYLYDGRTPGKLICQLKVVHEEGHPLTFSAVFLRWVLRPIDLWMYGLGVVIMLATNKNQRLGGLVSQTVVIRLPIKHLERQVPTIKAPQANYSYFYHGTSDVTARDMQTVHQVLNKPMSPIREQMSDDLAERIKTAYRIVTADRGRTFLLRLKQDYLHHSASSI